MINKNAILSKKCVEENPCKKPTAVSKKVSHSRIFYFGVFNSYLKNSMARATGKVPMKACEQIMDGKL